MKLKVNLETVLTTMVGGYPVTADKSQKSIDKLFKSVHELNSNLPFVEMKNATRDEVYEANRVAKMEAMIKLCPALGELRPDVEAIKKRLEIEHAKNGEITDAYLLASSYLTKLAELKVGAKHIVFNFENNYQAE